MANLVLETSGVGVDIADISLIGDFTIEFSVLLAAGEPVSAQDTVFSGDGVSFDFAGGVARFAAGGATVLAAPSSAPTGEWMNVALVRQGDSVALVMNGEYVALADWTGTLDITQIVSGLSGRLDGLRIWSEARTAEQIDEGTGGFVDISGGVPPALERYYRFDDDPEHIVDATGNAETGHDLHVPAGAAIVEDGTAPGGSEQDVAGFIDTKVVSGLFVPTDMAFLPDGRMLVTQKNGVVTLVEDPTQVNSPTSTYLDLSAKTLTEVEAGLISVAIDPDFETNGYIYLFYSNADENRTTVARFTHIENEGGTTSVADPASETVLWQEFDTFSDGHHQGGGLSIAYEPIDANDPSPYKLYIGVGEEFEGANSQDLTHDDGKIHRINLTDGSIPTDNPYYDPVAAAAYTPSIDTSSAISTSAENLALDAEGVISTIYAYGLRNPFRSFYDQESGTLWVGDVGGNNQNSWEDIHIIAAGADHGWPAQEGFHDPDDAGSPIHTYNHLTGPGVNQTGGFGTYGASVSGGVVYRGDAFPEEYQGAYFYGDWVRKWIRVLTVDYSTGEPMLVEDSHFANTTGQVLTFEEGPDGALYYLTTFQTGAVSTFEGTINRLVYDTSNRAPVGQGIVLDPGEAASTAIPHTVTFEADVSDPDGDALTYLWSFGDGDDLDGDGRGDTATSNEAAPTWTYTAPGEYIVELIVSDANGAAKVFDAQTIRVGNAPVVTIDSPADGMTFRAGDTITLTGSAIDVEDGVLGGGSVYWSAQFFHNEHTHPQISAVEDTPGGLTFEIPTIGHDYYGETGFLIYLTATDSSGLTTTEVVFIEPEESVVTYDMPNVAGFAFQLDGIFYTGDVAYDNVINFHHQLEVPESYIDNGVLYEFSHWSDDPALTAPLRTFVVPEADMTLSPVYENAGVVSQSLNMDPEVLHYIPPVALGQGGADFTIEGWVRFDGEDGISKVDGLVAGVDDAGKAFDINFHAGVAHFYSRALSTDVVTGTTQFAPGEWHHIAVTRENGVVSLYVDGQLDAASSTSWTSAITVKELGGSIGGGTYGLDGALDEVRFWSTVRSASEIAAGYDKLVAPDSAGLVRNYRFDGNGHDEVGSADLDLTGQSFVDGAPLSLEPVNLAPVAQADSVDLPQGFDPQASHIHILDNDSDPDGTINPQTVEIVAQSAHGTVEIIDTPQELADRGLPEGYYGHVEYAPHDPNFVGLDSFSYRVQDDQGAWSNVVTVQIKVGNPPPVAIDDSATLVTGFDPAANHLHILGNDTDSDGIIDPQTVEIVTPAAHGTVEILDTPEELAARGLSADHYGRAEYVLLDPDFVGTDSFSYRVQDGDGAWSNVATVQIEVVADPAPVASDDAFTLVQGFEPAANLLDVLANDTDNGSLVPQTVEILSGPVHGTLEVLDTAQELADRGLSADHYGEIEYTPTDPDFAGTDSFTYRVQDDQGGWSGPATATIEVLATPDGQALALDPSDSLDVEPITLGHGGADFTIEGWVRFDDADGISKVDGLVAGVDDAGKAFDINFHAGVAHFYSRALRTDVVTGTTQFAPGEWRHVAVTRENGAVSLYVDGQLDAASSTPWTSAITVNELGGSIGGGTYGLDGALDEVRFWSNARSATEIAAGYQTSVDPGESGLARYYGFDGTLADLTGNSATPAMPVGASYTAGATEDAPTPANQAPTGAGIVLDAGEFTGVAPHAVTFEADAVDPEGTVLVYSWDFGDGETSNEAAPSHLYDQPGLYSATLTVTDADGLSTTFGAVAIEVADDTEPPANTAPTAVSDLFAVDAGDTATILDVLSNDIDPDGVLVPATVEILSGPTSGTAEVLDTEAELLARGLGPDHLGRVEYTPGFAGTDSFVYRVQDDDGAWSDPVTVELDVSFQSPPPAAGYGGGAAEFNATGTGLDIVDVVLSGDFTMEAWVLFDPSGFINKYDSLFGAGVFDVNSTDDDATDGVFGNDLNFHHGKLNLYVSEAEFGVGVTFDDIAMEEGVWTHVALTREGAVYTAYVNGTAAAPKTYDFLGEVVVDRLGASINEGRVLDGRIDEFRLWSEARDAAEIADGMDGVDPTAAGLLRYYQFDDSTSVIDSTGQGEAAGDLLWSEIDALQVSIDDPFA